MRVPPSAIILTAVLVLAGCADRGLRNLTSNGRGPDDFAVLPAKPLTPPKSYTALPPPTPGGSNLVDQNPVAEGVVALGGRASALDPNQGIPASDGALVAQTSRHGVSPDIRSTLAVADADFRRRQARWSGFKLFPVDRYEQAYRKQAINPFPVTESFRRRNAGTPTSPPEFD